MNKISNYMVTQTGSRRTVTLTIERYYQDIIPNKSQWITEAVTYSYGPRDPMPKNPDEDAWQYTLPSGETFTHPNKHGCFHLILSDAIGAETAHTKAPKASGFIKTHNRL